ncbi:MAG TPA: phosphomethylpyrimidine synthase ThiC [Methanofollis liminatans]|uniref:Phosphomethylpyrimidine synthase ThiC n=1 Tax=Methanofollis liminatans TaxID=2201 RepID=A0A831LR00_9EURY|nr:phosphomethylpyrimidine synthase ThiC [Methanofollis liminatans]
MTNILEAAQSMTVTPAIRAVADDEQIDPDEVCRRIADGRVVVMQRSGRCVGIGAGLRTKINVNLGTSNVSASPDDEVKKARIAEKYGADTISDLSMGGDIPAIRAAVARETTLPLTTVPIYQAVAENGLENLTTDDILSTIRAQAEEGVSSLVVHCVNDRMLDLLKAQGRVMGVVSKGGSITASLMYLNHCQNPFIEHFDEVLAIAREHDIVLSLGNTARSGCIRDEQDAVQMEEMRQNIELAHYAHQHGVQVIIEGAGGHVRLDRIGQVIRSYKVRSSFPLFVAGPLPTDVAAGYDHIAGAVGASAASAAGADYLCYITPAEHLGLPTPEHVREGLIAFRIAAHIGDTVKRDADGRDFEMARHRAGFDRNGQVACSFDPERARQIMGNGGDGICTMCGDFCAIRLMRAICGSEKACDVPEKGVRP